MLSLFFVAIYQIGTSGSATIPRGVEPNGAQLSHMMRVGYGAQHPSTRKVEMTRRGRFGHISPFRTVCNCKGRRGWVGNF